MQLFNHQILASVLRFPCLWGCRYINWSPGWKHRAHISSIFFIELQFYFFYLFILFYLFYFNWCVCLFVESEAMVGDGLPQTPNSEYTSAPPACHTFFFFFSIGLPKMFLTLIFWHHHFHLAEKHENVKLRTSLKAVWFYSSSGGI